VWVGSSIPNARQPRGCAFRLVNPGRTGLQLRLQLATFAAVRRCSPKLKCAARSRHGTPANCHERDHDGLAVFLPPDRVQARPRPSSYGNRSAHSARSSLYTGVSTWRRWSTGETLAYTAPSGVHAASATVRCRVVSTSGSAGAVSLVIGAGRLPRPALGTDVIGFRVGPRLMPASSASSGSPQGRGVGYRPRVADPSAPPAT
jgi:hypothetical protein